LIFKRKNAVGLDWIDLVQGRDRWRAAVECRKENSGYSKCEEFLDKIGGSC